MIEKVIMFAIIIGISFIATKLNWFSDNVRDGLSRVIIRVTAPLLIFTSIAGLEADQTLFTEALTIAGISIVIIASLIGIGKLYVSNSSLDEKTTGVQVALMTFGNVVFIAFPIFQSLYGAKGIFYAAFYHLINDMFLWTVGVKLIDYKSNLSKKQIILNVINNNTVAIFLGLICLIFRVKFPPIIYNPIVGLGQTTVYLSLLFIGTTMAAVNVRETYKKFSIFVAVLVKMIIMPIIVGLILFKFGFGLSIMAMSVIVLQVAMPSMTIVAIIANELGVNYKYAAETVFVTTLFSLFTLPLILNFLFTLPMIFKFISVLVLGG